MPALQHLQGIAIPNCWARRSDGAGGDTLLAEQPLLLDPCADRPEEHLVFGEEGIAASETERGRTTILVLGLNRESLVNDRKQALLRLRTALHGQWASSTLDRAAAEGLVADNVEYAGALRQFLRPWLRELESAPRRARKTKAAEPPTAKAIEMEVAQALPLIGEEHRRATVEQFNVAQRAIDSYSIADEGAKEQYFKRTRFIERIEIRNFRPIEELVLHLTPAAEEDAAPGGKGGADATAAGWLMLLGENGAGKSSVLQAVALTLIGSNWRKDLAERLGLDATRCVRNGATEGSVRVYLTGSGSREPIEMTFSSSSTAFESSLVEAPVAILGYGSTRLLPRAGMRPQVSYDFARIDNLFNPFEPLNDATAWLLSLDEEPFDHVARALKILLDLDDEERLVRSVGTVEAEMFGTRVRLEEPGRVNARESAP